MSENYYNMEILDEIKFWNNLIKKHKFKNKSNKPYFFKYYTLDKIHIYKPIIRNYSSEQSKVYINYIVKLYNISFEESIIFLKKFNGNVYKTIIFL